MIRLDDIRNALDPATGSFALSVPLAGLPDPAGPPFALTADHAGASDAAIAGPVLGQPTGVLGLGWRLALARIEAVVTPGAGLDAPSFLLIGPDGARPLMKLGEPSAGIESYGTVTADFWIIRRHVAADLWEVVDERGITYSYGAIDGRDDAVQTAVAWGAWSGASIQTRGQAAMSVGWYLAKIVDLWGAATSLRYAQTPGTVGAGTASFTQSIYLSQVEGATGGLLQLTYADKTAAEYAAPHTVPPGPNAWQDPLETRYLASVTAVAPGGAVLETTQLGYALMGAAPAVKRLLTGIRPTPPAGRADPGLVIAYETADTASAAYGRPVSLTTRDGGVVEVDWTRVTPALSNRSGTIAPPTVAGASFGAPALSWGDDFAVALWTSGTATAAAHAYAWDGRWIAFDALSTSPQGGFAVSRVAASASSFAVQVDAALSPFTRDPRMAGAWVGAASPITATLTAGEASALACTEQAAAVLGLTSCKLSAALFDGAAWTALPVTTLAGAGSQPLATLAGGNGRIAAAVTDAQAQNSILVYLYRVDADRNWTTRTATLTRPNATLDGLTLQLGPTYALLRSTGPAGGGRTVAFDLIDLSRPGAPATQRILRTSIGAQDPLPVASIFPDGVAIGQQVWRYDGSAWNATALDTVKPQGAGALLSVSPGADALVRTFAPASGGGTICDVVTYDPNAANPSAAWTSTLTSTMPAGDFTARAALSPAGDPGAVICPQPGATANAVWRRQPDGAWGQAFALTDTLAAADLPSLQVMEGNYLVYQNGADVVAYALDASGVVASSRTVLTGATLAVPGQDASAALAGRFFSTYTGAWGPAARIALHYVSGVADGAASVAVVNDLRILPGAVSDPTTGYPVVVKTPTYTLESATVSPDGATARFNRVVIAAAPAGGGDYGSVQAEFFNGLTTAEAAALPAALQPAYPADATTNAAQYTRFLGGMLYRSTVTSVEPDGGTRSDPTSASLWVTERVYPVVGLGQGQPTGFYARVRTSVSQVDGVSATTVSTYDAMGRLATSQTSSLDTAGASVTRQVAQTYFSDVYPTAPVVNLLAQVVGTVTTSGGQTVAAEAETWGAWGAQGQQWGTTARFVATAATAASFTWNTATPPAGWSATETILTRNVQGTALATQSLGVNALDVCDKGGYRLVARFANAATGEASYCGFEPYESDTEWSYIGSSIAAQTTPAQFHTGTRSLRIDPNGAAVTGPTATFLSTAVDRSYLFSCWMLTPAGFTSDPATARWTLQVYRVDGTPQAVGAPVVMAFPATNGAWQYLQAVVDLGGIRRQAGVPAGVPLSVTLLACDNRAASTASYVDEARFSPLDSVYSAQVYDPAAGWATALLEENGATTRMVRDSAGRMAALVGPSDQNVRGVMAPAFAREMSGDDTFHPAFPNQTVVCLSSSFGVYHDFDPSDTGGWVLAPSWAISAGALRFSGTSADPIGSRAELASFVHSDYAARALVPAASAVGSSVSIGTGDLFVSWSPGQTAGQGAWLLRQQDGQGGWTTLASAPDGYREDWLFAVVDNVAFFFADGRQIFGVLLASGTQGKLQLAATGPAAFQQLVVAVDPSLMLNFSDGAGTSLISAAMVDRQTVQVGGALYDALGRVSYQRNPVSMTIAVAPPPGVQAAARALGDPAASTVTEGALTTYLPSKQGGGQMTLAEYLTPAVSGAPYAQSLFESSPYGRVIEEGAPGAAYAIPAGKTTKTRYSGNLASGPGDWLATVTGGTPAPGSYAIAVVTTPDGTVVETAANQWGQLIARALRPAAGVAPSSIESFVYDAGGRQSAHRLPNYYTLPSGSLADTWVQSAGYDFLGRMIAFSGPDTGSESYLSDLAGRARFVQTASDAAAVPPVIRYNRYDNLDRVVERGTLSGTAWSALAAHVDDPAWPSAADGAVWSERYVYDRPDTAGPYDPQPPFLVGRLATALLSSSASATPPASAIDTYRYAYDLAGATLSQDAAIPAYDAGTRRSLFDWDNLDRPIQITYPRTLDGGGQPQGTAVTTTYFYDRLGRMAGIGNAPEGTEVLDPSNPNPGPKARYADYHYGPDGLPSSIVYGLNSGRSINTAFAFDTAGRPTALGGDYFTQTIGYGAGGLDGAQNWSGRAVSSRAVYSSAPGSDAAGVLSDRTWLYRYDPAGRLNGAVASDVQQNAGLAAGTADLPVTYDANGTLLTVPRGPTSESYAYPFSNGARTGSAIQNLAVSAAQVVDFTQTTLPTGWSSGASNQGPSASGRVTSGDPDAPFFRLAGGAPGHQEYLGFQGALGEQGVYSLAVRWRSAAALAGQSGPAGVQLVLNTADGASWRAPLADFSAGSAAWCTDTLTVDVAQAVASAALKGQVVSAGIAIVNGKCAADGTAGASLDIKSLTLATPAATAPTPITYDASGRMTALPMRGIASISYNRSSGRVTAIGFESGAPISSVAFNRDPAGRISCAVTTYADGTQTKALFARAPGGGLLATETTAGTGAPSQRLLLRDEQRVFGQVPASAGDPALYRLFDRAGSLRAVAAEGDGPTAGLVARLDYDPFGVPILASGPASASFAGHGIEPASNLFDMQARFYDPKLRAFVTPDAALATAWPYAYAGGDPVNWVDPDGNVPQWAQDVFYSQRLRWGIWMIGAAYQAYQAWQLGQQAWENPTAAAADLAELAASVAAGAVLRLALNAPISLAQGAITSVVHAGLAVPRYVPVMSIMLDVSGGAYWGSCYGVTRVFSGYWYRDSVPQLTAGAVLNSTVQHGLSGAASATVQSIYRHFLSPTIWFPSWRGAAGIVPIVGTTPGGQAGPMVHTKGTKSYFVLADGTYAFEEYMKGSAYVPWFLQRGNPDMKYDTNMALALSQPVNYLRGMGYGKACYKATGLVLEHRTTPGWTLFMSHPDHTPSKGGPTHIGISTFIKGNVLGLWTAAHAAPWAISTLASARQFNMTGLMGSVTVPRAAHDQDF